MESRCSPRSCSLSHSAKRTLMILCSLSSALAVAAASVLALAAAPPKLGFGQRMAAGDGIPRKVVEDARFRIGRRQSEYNCTSCLADHLEGVAVHLERMR